MSNIKQHTKEIEIKLWSLDDSPQTSTTKNETINGLRKSTKNWDEDTRRKKFEKVQDLSLVSRSNVSNDEHSLKNVKLQHDLWNHIQEKISEGIKDEKDKKEWDPIVDLLRKLREGVYATHWSYSDYSFAIKVFELSADCCVKAERYEELSKSLIGLLDHLYTKISTTCSQRQSYYVVLSILYHSCYLQNLKLAWRHVHYLDLNTHEGNFGKHLLKSISQENPIHYFRLYHYNPYWTFKVLMNNYNDVMRRKAINTLRKAYLSTSISWIGQWIGIYHDNNIVLKEMDRLVKPSCILSVDYERQLVYFNRKKVADREKVIPN
ncbi:uncharacterized protein BX663DRAFT_555737 [Cokeromyces recurvatus]|uniref:uncharacterized protein n=1 Tax=Cokeromyces recurvatus TaxID=90255 RepID=UPI00221F47FC|nr:uncharacterized protein BX663DRAFT_555737 [Cokeromyces recurvatus]KAI7898523.1 hypothetical protein BX663DRAFT_555737 [Cokeromyces recurvatus]